MKGRQKHADRLKILSGQGRLIKAVGRVLYVGADMIRAEAHRSISKGSRSGKKHKPSAENTPPNRDTGVLQAHIRAALVAPLEAQVTSEAPYAAALENGSSRKAGTTSRSFNGHTTTYGPNKAKHGPVKVEYGDSTMEARPYMRPARDTKAPEIQRLFETEIDKLVKGSGS
jgi:HK97 gp10 family phage protein